jgi:hypothetical protein
MLGTLCAALFCGAISVYIFRDVDRDKIDHLDEAFAELCAEFVIFTLAVGAGVALLTLLGRYLFRLKGHYTSSRLGLFLGIGVGVFQYVWDFAGRVAFPKFADPSLFLYLIIAIVFCSIVLVRDNVRQTKLCQTSAAKFDSCEFPKV